MTSLLGDAYEYPSKVKSAGFKPSLVDYDNDDDLDFYMTSMGDSEFLEN